METTVEKQPRRLGKGWICLSMILWIVARFDGTLADCPTFKDKVIELTGNTTAKILQSPGYPDNTPTDCTAEWLITSDSDRVKFTFLDLDLDDIDAESASCQKANLTFYNVYNQTVEWKLFSINVCAFGQIERGHTFLSRTKMIRIVFSSDSSTQKRGFQIAYQAEDACECDTETPIELNADDNFKPMTSPGYPNQYPLSCQCRWLIKSDKRLVEYAIETMDMEYVNKYTRGSDPCEYDYLLVADGPTNENGATPSNKLCLPDTSLIKRNRTYFAQTKEALFTFYSDFTASRSGFKMYYKAADWPAYPSCHGKVTELKATSERRTVTVPDSNQRFIRPSNCTWKITGDLHSLEVYVKDIQYAPGCNGDFIKIYSEDPVNHDSLKPLTSSCDVTSMEVDTGSKTVTIEMVSNGAINGFSFDYSASESIFSDDDDCPKALPIIGIILGVIGLVIIIGVIIKVGCRMCNKRKGQSAPSLNYRC